jgi:hypothetical protein
MERCTRCSAVEAPLGFSDAAGELRLEIGARGEVIDDGLAEGLHSGAFSAGKNVDVAGEFVPASREARLS